MPLSTVRRPISDPWYLQTKKDNKLPEKCFATNPFGCFRNGRPGSRQRRPPIQPTRVHTGHRHPGLVQRRQHTCIPNHPRICTSTTVPKRISRRKYNIPKRMPTLHALPRVCRTRRTHHDKRWRTTRNSQNPVQSNSGGAASSAGTFKLIHNPSRLGSVRTMRIASFLQPVQSQKITRVEINRLPAPIRAGLTKPECGQRTETHRHRQVLDHAAVRRTRVRHRYVTRHNIQNGAYQLRFTPITRMITGAQSSALKQ